jgi:4-amino-4-deoxy-L-arabinose transferase-like glycosyltransferase
MPPAAASLQRREMTGNLALVGRGRRLLTAGPDWIRWLAVFLLLALGIGLRSPWPADEPRFALAAMDMVLNDHWLLPHRGGQIYADKPPVFMWLQAVFFQLGGSMRIAFLLPSLLASMGTLWLVQDLTRRLYGREQAWFAVLLLLTTLQFTMQAKSAQIDATVTGFVMLGIYGLTRYHCIAAERRWLVLAWLAMGVGIITKGVGFLPVFLLPGFILAAWQSRTERETKRDRFVYAAPLLLLLPAVLWLTPLMLSAYGGGNLSIAAYLDEILFHQTVTRYAAGFAHPQPFWYYLVEVIPFLWLPLSLLLIWLIPDWARHLRGWSVLHWGLLGYVLLSLLFFSYSPGKRGVYLLPLLPALAVLAGGSLPALEGRQRPVQLLRALSFLVGVVLMLTAAAAVLGVGKLTDLLERTELPMLPVFLLLLSLGLCWVLAAVLIRSGGAFTAAVVATWLLLSTAGYLLLDPVRSAEQLMREVASHLEPDSELAIIKFREQQLLQADRPVVHWRYYDDVADQMADAVAWLQEGQGRYLLVPEGPLSSCLPADTGQWIGFRHGRDWRLLTVVDLGSDLDCSGDAGRARRLLAPYVAYPTGKKAKG